MYDDVNIKDYPPPFYDNRMLTFTPRYLRALLVVVTTEHGRNSKVETHAVDNEADQRGRSLQNRIIISANIYIVLIK